MGRAVLLISLAVWALGIELGVRWRGPSFRYRRTRAFLLKSISSTPCLSRLRFTPLLSFGKLLACTGWHFDDVVDDLTCNDDVDDQPGCSLLLSLFFFLSRTVVAVAIPVVRLVSCGPVMLFLLPNVDSEGDLVGGSKVQG